MCSVHEMYSRKELQWKGTIDELMFNEWKTFRANEFLDIKGIRTNRPLREPCELHLAMVLAILSMFPDTVLSIPHTCSQRAAYMGHASESL